MVVVGLTGGIGSGKSTVGRFLVQRGAVLVDADVVARQIVEPGQPVLAALVERFGATIVGPGGRLDRSALAAVAFADDRARRDLNRITHPAIIDEMRRQVAAVGDADPQAVVVMDIPLLAEASRDRHHLDGVLVVDVPIDTAVARLTADRGFTEDAARARLAAQATREQRRAIADVVIDNSGDLDQLRDEVDRAWTWIRGLKVRSVAEGPMQRPASGPGDTS